VYKTFLSIFINDLGGSPLFLTLVAVFVFYGAACLRKVPLSLGGLTVSLLGLSIIAPGTMGLDTMVIPRPLPLLAVAALELGLAFRRRASWHALLGAACLVVAATTELGSVGLEGYRRFVAFHLCVFSAVLIGMSFDDSLARFLERLAAILLALACLYAAQGGSTKVPVAPPGVLRSYPAIVILASGVFGYLTGSRIYLGSALAGLAGWLTSIGWRTYCDLRRLVVGLNWIVSGLAFFVLGAAISLGKAGILARWIERRLGMPLQQFLGDAD
jgi:hypothetical protein